MSDGITIDFARFEAAAARTMAYTHRSFEEELRSQARGVMKEIIAITPPRSGKGFSSPKTAEAQGQGKMRADLIGGGSGRGKRRAGVFVVLSDSLVDSAIETDTFQSENVRLWTRRDGTVYGTQRSFFRPDASISEMRAHHKEYFKNGQMSRAGTYTRDIGRWKWIDQMIIRASTWERYWKHIAPRVGYYAGGWGPGARALKVPLPPYARRNSSTPGRVDITIQPNRLRIVIENAANFSSVDRDMARRVQWAVNVQATKMERRLPFLMRAAARMGGLQS